MPEGNGNLPHYIPGDEFHREVRRVYFGGYNWAVNKKHGNIAHVVYDGVHDDPRLPTEMRGRGKDYATWVFSEEPGCEEGLFETNFELMIDATFEPNAAIGLHFHHRTEEIYYLIEGSVTMTTVSEDGEEWTETLYSGDAHLVRLGQGHYGQAGDQGVRFIAVAVRK